MSKKPAKFKPPNQKSKKKKRKISIRSTTPNFRSQIITFKRIAKTGTKNIFRNAWLTTAATAIMVVTLVVVSLGVILSTSLNSTVDEITNEVALEVFLHDEVDDLDLKKLKTELSDDDNVKYIEFVSKSDALKQFQEEFKNDPEILKGLALAENTLPASYKVYLFDLASVDSSIVVAQDEQYSEVVDSINFDEKRKASIDRIASWQDFIIYSSLIAGSIFAFISVLIIFNTIRMAIFTRSYEIEIMKLIGATPGYIRGPFLFEASLYGIFAGLITLLFLYSVVLTGLPQLGQFLEFSSTTDFLKEKWFVVGAFVIGLGVLIGFLSAVIAMAKYLRLKKW